MSRPRLADDFADIKARLEALSKPPFTVSTGCPGSHCRHCLTAEDESCGIACLIAYRQRYGFDPPGPAEPK